jgi:hypothetical protein
MSPQIEISDARLGAAQSIHTQDPANPNSAGYQLWGHRSEASQPTDSESQNIFEIALPSDDHQGLLDLITRIEAVKGRLPPDVIVLRKNLK